VLVLRSHVGLVTVYGFYVLSSWLWTALAFDVLVCLPFVRYLLLAFVITLIVLHIFTRIKKGRLMEAA